MASTPTHNRLKLTPSNSPFLGRSSRSPFRSRVSPDSRLSLKRVIGTTCCSPTGFDTFDSSFAYIAGGAVVVVDVDGEQLSQRFYRARPTAIPLYSVPTTSQKASQTPSGTPKAGDNRGRVAAGHRESPHGAGDWSDSGSKTWTSRERIKAATCVALSRDGKYLAVGETGYAPRVLIFSLHDASSDTPLVSISEHAHGVNAVAWSADTKWLASLGAANDGFIYIWKVDPRSGAAKLFQQNRCTSYIRDMLWIGNSLITLGVRHVKIWKVEEIPVTSPTKQKFHNDSNFMPPSQRTLPGRNILLGSMLEATFNCAAVANNLSLVVCTDAGDVCILDDDDKQLKLVKVLTLDFPITSIAVHNKHAYIGGKEGQFVTLDVDALLDCKESCVLSTSNPSPNGLVAMGFLADKLVTIDSSQSIDIWKPGHGPGDDAGAMAHVPLPGNGEPVTGIQPLPKTNGMSAAFLTWSSSGNVTFWDLDGHVKLSVDVPMEIPDPDDDSGPVNQLTHARTTIEGSLLITGDRLGVLKITDIGTKQCLVDTKAHSSECHSVSIFEDGSTLLMASCGRDRTAQLFHRTCDGNIEHFQTLEFAAKVVQVLIPTEDRVLTCSFDRTLQVHDLVSKEGEPDVLAAIPSKLISLKASPTSMVMGPDNKTVFISLMDRSVYQFDISTGRQVSHFKCYDEGGVESAVLDSLSIGTWLPKDQEFLLGTSNTDKSIRLYDAQNGAFLDREWGHTEAINGVCLVEDDDESRKVVSVGSDGTIMIWTLDLDDPPPGSLSRDPSPVKDGVLARTPLRRVLSKAELAEFQRQSPGSGRKSPPRSLQRRTSRLNLSSSASRTPTGPSQLSPSSSIMLDTPTRRPSADDRSSPPLSPKGRLSKKPSIPSLGQNLRKKTSSSSLRAFGSLNMATEQTCRTLRAYRKKLTSSETIDQEILCELDQELRVTAAALGERAIRSRALNETVLSDLLDQYSERLIAMLDEKLQLTNISRDRDADSPDEDSRESADGDTSSISS